MPDRRGSEPANDPKGQSVGANQDLPRARYEDRRLTEGDVRRVIREELERINALKEAEYVLSRICRECGGGGVVNGFWLGTRKTCPSCHGCGITRRGGG